MSPRSPKELVALYGVREPTCFGTANLYCYYWLDPVAVVVGSLAKTFFTAVFGVPATGIPVTVCVRARDFFAPTIYSLRRPCLSVRESRLLPLDCYR